MFFEPLLGVTHRWCLLVGKLLDLIIARVGPDTLLQLIPLQYLTPDVAGLQRLQLVTLISPFVLGLGIATESLMILDLFLHLGELI